MKRINIWIDDEYLDFLKSRKGQVSEQIRYAVGQYINQIRKDELKVSASQSKGVDLNG